MIPALSLLLLFQLGGEIASRVLSLPVPGPVVGMVAMVVVLAASRRVLDTVRPVIEVLLAHLSLLFVPAGVGIVAHLSLLADKGVAIMLAVFVSTIAAIAVGALVFTWVAKAMGILEVGDD